MSSPALGSRSTPDRHRGGRARFLRALAVALTLGAAIVAFLVSGDGPLLHIRVCASECDDGVAWAPRDGEAAMSAGVISRQWKDVPVETARLFVFTDRQGLVERVAAWLGRGREVRQRVVWTLGPLRAAGWTDAVVIAGDCIVFGIWTGPVGADLEVEGVGILDPGGTAYRGARYPNSPVDVVGCRVARDR